MKKTAIAPEATDVDDHGWGDALRLFAADLQRHGAAEKALRAYGSEVRRLARWAIAEAVRPEAVDLAVLRRYLATPGAQPPAPAAVARKLAALRAFFRVMRAHGHIAQNPVDLVGAPARPAEAAGATTPLDVRDRAMFALAGALGLAADELVGLDVGGIAEGRLTMSDGRVLPLVEPARTAVRRYLDRARPALGAGDGEPALFLSKTGRRLSTGDVRRRLRTSELQGGVTAHALRHGIATQLLEGGADLRAIQDLLGRSTVSTTPTTTRVDSARLKTAYARSHPRA